MSNAQLYLGLGLTSAQRRANDKYRKSPKGMAAVERYEAKRRARPLTPHQRQRATESARRHYERNRERILAGQRDYQLLKRFGITSDDYDAMLAQQGGVCAICGADRPDRSGKRVNFAVDHDHETGRVRGLLCSNCNSALGLLGERLHEAVAYLS